MPRTYSVSFTSQTLAAASGDIDLWELTPADDKPVKLLLRSKDVLHNFTVAQFRV